MSGAKSVQPGGPAPQPEAPPPPKKTTRAAQVVTGALQYIGAKAEQGARATGAIGKHDRTATLLGKRHTLTTGEKTLEAQIKTSKVGVAKAKAEVAQQKVSLALSGKESRAEKEASLKQAKLALQDKVITLAGQRKALAETIATDAKAKIKQLYPGANIDLSAVTTQAQIREHFNGKDISPDQRVELEVLLQQFDAAEADIFHFQAEIDLAESEKTCINSPGDTEKTRDRNAKLDVYKGVQQALLKKSSLLLLKKKLLINQG